MLTWVQVAVAALAAAIGLSSTYIFKMGDDNQVEEAAEQVIKNETGHDIDLTPKSPEK